MECKLKKSSIDKLRVAIIDNLKNTNYKRDLSNEEYFKLYKEEEEEIKVLVEYMLNYFEDVYECIELVEIMFEEFQIFNCSDLESLIEDVDSKESIIELYDGENTIQIYHCSLDTFEYHMQNLEDLYDDTYLEEVAKIFPNNDTMQHHTKQLWLEIEVEIADGETFDGDHSYWKVVK